MHIVCTDNYGLTEVMGPGVSGECLWPSATMQHIAEDHFLWEVIDPETGEPVAEGEDGRARAHAPLQAGHSPVLRYRTHDLTRRASPSPARCGRTLARMDKVRSRSDDMLIIRGTNVFPLADRGRAHGHRGALTPHYHIIVDDHAAGMDAHHRG